MTPPPLRCLIAAASLLLAACVTPAEPVATIPRPLPEADPAIFLAVVPQSDRTRPNMGTAFLITPTLLVTNRHVVEGGHGNQVLLTQRGRTTPLEGRVVWSSRGSTDFADLAVIELAAPLAGVTPLRFASPPTAGQRVVASGYPGRNDFPSWILAMTVERLPIELPQSSRRLGSVIAERADANGRWFETSSVVVGGISGGPMLDACGRVVGIVTRTRLRGETQSSTLAQTSLVATEELNTARAALGLQIDSTPCTARLPDGTVADSEGQALTVSPWPIAGWLPPRYGDWVRGMRGQPSAPDRVSSLAIDEGWQQSYWIALAPDAASADQGVLEYCEVFTGQSCRVISRSTGAPETQPAAVRQPRLQQRSSEFRATEAPFLLPADARWLSARFAERDASRTAVAVHPSGGGFVSTSDTAANAVATVLANCRRYSGFEPNLCLLYWDGSRTTEGTVTRAGLVEQMRNRLRIGRPLDPQLSEIEGASSAVLQGYVQREQPKALAGDPTSNRTFVIDRRGSLEDATRLALEVCEFTVGRPCRLYAANDVALTPEERGEPRPQRRLVAPSLTELPFIDTNFANGLRTHAARSTAAGRPWAIAIHPSGAFQFADAASQEEADTAALTSCQRYTAQRIPENCKLVARGNGRPGEPFRTAEVGR